jgi:hypothetical protein
VVKFWCGGAQARKLQADMAHALPIGSHSPNRTRAGRPRSAGTYGLEPAPYNSYARSLHYSTKAAAAPIDGAGAQPLSYKDLDTGSRPAGETGKPGQSGLV